MNGQSITYERTTHQPVELCWGGKVMKKASGGLAQHAQDVANAGIKGDSMIIHVNPEEFHEMTRMFGPAKMNPHTGMPSFFPDEGEDWSWMMDQPEDTSGGGGSEPTPTPSVPATPAFSGRDSTMLDATGTMGGNSSSWFGALPMDAVDQSGNQTQAQPEQSAFQQLKNALGLGDSKDSSSGSKDSKSSGALGNILKLATIGSVLNGMFGKKQKGAAPPPQNNDVNFTSHLPLLTTPRTAQAAPAGYNPLTAATTGGERVYFANNKLPSTTYAARGGLMHYAHGGHASPHYVAGVGTGRSDDIPARLSDGEYVMDAETVAMLGDGSSKAGAQRLDQFRQNIRKQKGVALAQGKISPDAKEPQQYLKGGLTHGRY